jgi:predicted membrane channel-forming protein YqfA (hemolysin III family)
MFTPTNPVATALLSLSPESLWIPEHSAVPNDFWQGLVNVTVSADKDDHYRTITKTSGGTGWNASGYSCVYIPGNGWVNFTVNDKTLGKVAGLSMDNPDNNYNTIDYGIYPAADGNVYVSENGVLSGSLGAYNIGDVFTVGRVGATITYYHNGVSLGTSGFPTTSPLIFDSSINDVGVVISNVVFFGTTRNQGPLQNLINVAFPSPYTPGLNYDLWVTKNAGGAFWNSNVSSTYALNGDGFVEFSPAGIGTYAQIKCGGLCYADPNMNPANINYGFYFNVSGQYQVMENGVAKTAFATCGLVYKISISGTVVTYYLDGSLVYTSLTARASNPLIFGGVMYTVGGGFYIKTWSKASPRILTLKDLTDHGHTVVQQDPLKMPLFDATVFGGIPYALFDGTRQDSMAGPFIDTGTNGPYTVIAIRRWRSLAGYRGLWWNGNGGFANGMFDIVITGGGNEQIWHCPGYTTGNIDTPPSTAALHCIIARYDGATTFLAQKDWVDAAPQAIGGYTAPAGSITVGSYNTGVEVCDADLYLLAFFKRSLSTADMTILHNVIHQYYQAYGI